VVKVSISVGFLDVMSFQQLRVLISCGFYVVSLKGLE